MMKIVPKIWIYRTMNTEDSECISEFRVRKRDLPKLRDALQIPNSFTCYQKSVSDGMEGLYAAS